MSLIILPRRRIWQPDTPAALAPAWAGARVVVTPGYLAAAGAPITTESVGRAWNFNGSNQYVDLGASPASFSTMTVGLLLRVDTSSTFGLPIASSNGLNSAGFDFIADADLNPFRIYPRIRNASTRYSVTTTYTSVRGAWEMHVATLYGGTLRHYVNGREYGSVAAPGSFAPTQNLMLARRGTTYFPCRVALAFEYPFAWSADQIRQHAENPWQIFKQAPRRLYFDAGSGAGPTPTTLTGRSLAASPTVTRGAISQTRVLTGRSLSNAPTLSRGAVVQGSVTTLTGRSLSAAPTVSRGAISQTRVLTGRSLANAPTVTRAAISQDETVQLTGRNLAASPTITRGAISQTRALQGRSVLASPTLTRGAITQLFAQALGARNLTAAGSLSRGAIRQTHILAARSLQAGGTVYVPRAVGDLGPLLVDVTAGSLAAAVAAQGLVAAVVPSQILAAVTSAPLRAQVQ